jgi:hypothetical protein
MGKVFDGLDGGLREFLAAQQVFFVATAPLSPRGHVNLSPKGLDTFRVLGPRPVAYLGLTGSGVETVAHLRENGRITLMFCALAGPHRILRLYGKGRVVEPGDEEWSELAGQFPRSLGDRRRAGPGGGLVRLRGAAVRVRRAADAAAGLGRAEGGRGPRPLQEGEEPREHRRAARAATDWRVPQLARTFWPVSQRAPSE